MSKTRVVLSIGAWIALTALPATADDPNRPIQLTPGAGQVLRAGSAVAIHWDAQLPRCARNFFGEQEINLSLDGGRTFPYRITPRLSYGDRSYVWRVPNLPTEEAVLDLRYGCENEPGECEPYRTIVDALNPQYENRFRTESSRAEYVGHPSLTAPKNARAGSKVSLSWEASVRNLDHYEVWASVDRGGQFEQIGRANKPSFEWTLPGEGLRCTYFFKVAAVKLDGTRIESVVDTTQLVFVGLGQ